MDGILSALLNGTYYRLSDNSRAKPPAMLGRMAKAML
jgi:hypothetical protein